MIIFFFFSYTHVQFKQLHKYIQKRKKIYKNWYTQKHSLDIKLFGISRKQQQQKKGGMLAHKVLSHLLLKTYRVVEIEGLIRLIQIKEH